MKNDDTAAAAAAKFDDLEDDTVSEALSHFNLSELDTIRRASKSLGKVCNDRKEFIHSKLVKDASVEIVGLASERGQQINGRLAIAVCSQHDEWMHILRWGMGRFHATTEISSRCDDVQHSSV